MKLLRTQQVREEKMHSKATLEVLAISCVKINVYEQTAELNMITNDKMLLKNCQLSFYSPFIPTGCMSFLATK